MIALLIKFTIQIVHSTRCKVRDTVVTLHIPSTWLCKFLIFGLMIHTETDVSNLQIYKAINAICFTYETTGFNNEY